MVVVVNTQLLVLATGLGTALGAAFGILFRAVVQGKDAHISYAQDVNADLTEISRAAVGITGGALQKVPREHTGRRGS